MNVKEITEACARINQLKRDARKHSEAIKQAESKLKSAKESLEEVNKEIHDTAARLPDDVRIAVLPESEEQATPAKGTDTRDWLTAKLTDGPVEKKQLMKEYKDDGIGKTLQLRHHAEVVEEDEKTGMVSLRTS